MSNYNEQLQQHNTQLQSLIDTANALPEAGSSSGGNASSLQIVTGSFTPSSWDLYNNPITISGCEFKPKYVFICNNGILPVAQAIGYYPNVVLTSIFGSDDNIPLIIASYINASTQSVATAKIYTQANEIYNISFNNDGFTISATESAGYIDGGRTWIYYAIG